MTLCVCLVLTGQLWYKNDLRVDDHPGLLAACAAGGVAPVFVFDAKVLAPLLHMPAGPEGAYGCSASGSEA